MKNFRRWRLVSLATLLLATSLSAQLPELVYLPFDSWQSQNLNMAHPGTNLTMTPGNFLFDTGMVGSSLNPNGNLVTLNSNLYVTSGFTIECWARSDFSIPASASTHTQTILSGHDFEIRVAETLGFPRKLTIWVGKTSYSYGIFHEVGTVSQGIWHHLAVSCDLEAGLLRHYLDGIMVNSMALDAYIPLTVVNSMRIGQFAGGVTTPFDGRIDELRIWDHARSPAEIAAHYSASMQALPADLRIQDLASPIAPGLCDQLGTSEQLSVEVESFGTASLPAGTTLTWTYSLNGGAVVSETEILATALNLGESSTFTFASNLNLSARINHRIAVSCSTSVGGNSTTDSKEFQVLGSGPNAVYEFPWVETFPNKIPPLPFSPSAVADGWESTMDMFNTQMTGIPYFYPRTYYTVHTDPSYIYQDSSLIAYGGPVGITGKRTVTLPCMDLTGLTNPVFGCWLHSTTVDFNKFLFLDVQDVDSGIWSLGVDSIRIANTNSTWKLFDSDLSAFAGTRIRLALRSSLAVDMVMDDFSIVEVATTGPGQAPLLGHAKFEINHSFGSGHDRPRSGDPGPYFAQTRVGELINFRFSGEPNQYLCLFWGALNPASINYGAIGLCDVGGGLDADTGLPANIWIIANGFAPSQPIDFLFKTDINGDLFLTTVTPPLPFGSNGAFQALFNTTNGNWLALSNAVELMVR